VLRVRLEREIELAVATVRWSDWPGSKGPLVHVPDLLLPSSGLAAELAQQLSPEYRVLSMHPQTGLLYQLHVAELVGLLDQFGFEQPILIGEQSGCVVTTLLAGWYPKRLAGLILLDPIMEAADVPGIVDCPPKWDLVWQRIVCPTLREPGSIEAFLKRIDSPATPRS
jgi:pimeloyl-ACP methyl ester carboxylesterase